MWRDDQPVFPNTASSSPALFLPPIVTFFSCPNSAQGLLVRSTVAIRGRLLPDSSFELRIVSLLQLAALTTIQARTLDTLCRCLSPQNLTRRFNPTTVPDGAGNLSYYAVSRRSVPQLQPRLTQVLGAR